MSVADKSFPAAAWGTPVDELDVALSDFATPLVTLDRSALADNSRAMAGWASERGVLLAPHGKTSMAPLLWRQLLADGAWAITLATGWQVQVAHAHGVRRVLMTAPALDPGFWRWLAHAQTEGLEVICWADSLDAVMQMSRLSADAPHPVRVLVELGGIGGRTGARSIDDALAIARAIERAPGLELAGAGGYEGALAHDRSPEGLGRVRAYVAQLADLVSRLGTTARPIVSAGGSAYPDLVADGLAQLTGGTDVVLRAGAFHVHDDGFYAGISPLRDRLRAAMHGWARVISTPEPGFAILDGGKRDFPFDEGMPVRQRINGRAAAGAEVLRLNDQHAFLAQPAHDPVSVGDVVRLGLSHPCTALDKWRLVPLLDDAHAPEPRVVGAVETWF